MTGPTASVIMPVFNARDFIARAIESVLAQTLQDWELLLIDDGSTDDSGAICDAYARQHPERIRVIHQANAGISRAENRGMDEARGTYLAFLDDDDYLSADFLGELCSQAHRGGAEICKGLCMLHHYDGRQTLHETEINARIARSGSFLYFFSGWWTVVYRRDFINHHALRFIPDLGYAMDAVFQSAAVIRCRRLELNGSAQYHYCTRPDSTDGRRLRPGQGYDAVRAFTAIAGNAYRCQNRFSPLSIAYVYERCCKTLQMVASKSVSDAEGQACRNAAAELLRQCPHYIKEELRRRLGAQGGSTPQRAT